MSAVSCLFDCGGGDGGGDYVQQYHEFFEPDEFEYARTTGFAEFVLGDFQTYVSRMRKDGTEGSEPVRKHGWCRVEDVSRQMQDSVKRPLERNDEEKRVINM